MLDVLRPCLGEDKDVIQQLPNICFPGHPNVRAEGLWAVVEIQAWVKLNSMFTVHYDQVCS